MVVAKKDAQANIRENRYKKAAAQSAPAGRGWLLSLFWILSGAAAIIAMSLVFVFGYDWATQCDYFRSEIVRVKGAYRLSPFRVMEAAGIREGVNILSVNLRSARRRLLAMDWIADAEIRREFPDIVTIRIREHEPVAVIDLGRPFLDKDRAEIFREADGDDFSTLPVIKGVDYADWRNLEGHATRVVCSVMAIVRSGREKKGVFADHRIEQIRVDRDLGLVLAAGGLPVDRIQLGYGDYGAKLQRLEKILLYLKTNEPSLRLEKMDLRNPNRIVARPAMENQTVTIRKKEA